MDANGTHSYATAAETSGKANPTGKPVFIKHRDIPLVREKDMETQEMYKSLLKIVPSVQILGIQRIGGLWRLYIADQVTRIQLITEGLNIRDSNIAVYDTNPFLPGGNTNENLLKLTVKDIPLSVDNSVIIDELERRKYKVSGRVVLPKLRVDGKLTNCLTGDRVIFIERPQMPLPRLVTFGTFRGKVFHFNQTPKDQTDVICSNCLNKGHHRSSCTKQVVCRFCKKEGHYQRNCTTPIGEHSEALGKTPVAPGPAAEDSAPQQGTNAKAGPRQGIPMATRRSADSRQDSEPRRHTHTSANKETASASTQQCKITQFIQQERDATTMREEVCETPVGSGDEASDREGENFETDESEESDISIESPELPKAGRQSRPEKNKKRKQKKEKKPKKK